MFRNIKYILAKCSYGQKLSGVDKGPQTLFNLLNKNKQLKFKTVNNEEFISYKGYKKIYKNVSNCFDNNNFPIILGGDHSISLATVPAVFNKYKENVKIIWFDAHADINTKETSPSGNLHGMPLAQAFNLMEPIIKIDYKPSFEQLIYIGLRSIDPFEKYIIKNKGITCYFQEDIDKYGINKIMKDVNEKINGDKIHISFDIDVLDPIYMPSTGTPEYNGMSLNDANKALVYLIKKNKITSLDFVEFNPSISNTHKTINNCLYLLKKFT